jgi:Ca2+-binding EF-hand superfamily protein
LADPQEEMPFQDHDIKKTFDHFDRNLDGSIDSNGIPLLI